MSKNVAPSATDPPPPSPTPLASLNRVRAFFTPSGPPRLTIRSSLRRVCGGALAVAPVRGSGSARRLGSMATETVSSASAQNSGATAATMAIETVSSAPAQNNGTPTANVKTKLHGRAFYESIGSPKLVLAPMVEQSEFVCFIESLSCSGSSDSSPHRPGDSCPAPSSPPRSRPTC